MAEKELEADPTPWLTDIRVPRQEDEEEEDEDSSSGSAAASANDNSTKIGVTVSLTTLSTCTAIHFSIKTPVFRVHLTLVYTSFR